MGVFIGIGLGALILLVLIIYCKTRPKTPGPWRWYSVCRCGLTKEVMDNDNFWSDDPCPRCAARKYSHEIVMGRWNNHKFEKHAEVD